MYREQWVADILGNRSVLCVALDVHMGTTGSAERSPDEQSNDVKALREVVATWTNVGVSAFDDAVLNVIKQAVFEYDKSESMRMLRDIAMDPLTWVAVGKKGVTDGAGA